MEKLINSPLLPIFLLQISLLSVQSHSIVFFNAVSSHSTRLSQWPLMEALAERGHDVTYLSQLKDFENRTKTSKVKIYNPPKWTGLFKGWDGEADFYEMRKNGDGSFSELIDWMSFLDVGNTACEALVTDPELLEWAKGKKVDLVVMEAIFDECGYAFVHLWNAKLVQYSTCTTLPWQVDKFGLAEETSSLPDNTFPGFLNSVRASQGPSFLQRVKNALSPVLFAVWREWLYLPKMEGIIKQNLGQNGTNFPGLREIEKNTSLLLATTHFSMDHPRSLPPHMIPIGGNVVAKKMKPLPKEIEAFINSSSQGFIYVSFGTAMDFTTFPKEVQLGFISALESFPEMKFVWKLHKPVTTRKLPPNVLEAKWVPQQSILSHPKIKAFITHSGMGSTVESIHFGVPLIMIPIIPEQEYNAGIVSGRGAGIKLELVDLKKEHLEGAIREILNNDKHKKAMNKLSRISQDRPVTPMENGVWWIEYVLRHERDIHEFLVPPSIHQPWWVRRQIDVWAGLAGILLAVGLVLLTIVYQILKIFLRKFILGSKDSSNAKSKLKKN